MVSNLSSSVVGTLFASLYVAWWISCENLTPFHPLHTFSPSVAPLQMVLQYKGLPFTLTPVASDAKVRWCCCCC